MVRQPTIRRLTPLLADQWGLVTRGQAARAGVPHATFDRLVADEDLIERVCHGVYRLKLAPTPDHLGLRAAWLQLAPETPAWERGPERGVVSHRSAAALYGIGDLPADRHEFTLPTRRQTRRRDVRLHRSRLEDGEWIWLRGLPVTRAARIAADLLQDSEGFDAVAQITVDAIRATGDDPSAFAAALAPHAERFGLRRRDGLALLHWLLDLVGDLEASRRVHEPSERLRASGAPRRPSHNEPAARQSGATPCTQT